MRSEYEIRKHVQKYTTAQWHRNRPIDYTRVFNDALNKLRGKILANMLSTSAFVQYWEQHQVKDRKHTVPYRPAKEMK